MTARLTRRGALIAAAAVPLAARTAPAGAAPAGDAGALRDAMRLEQAAAFAYGAAVSGGGARLRAIARRFVEHEVEHVDVLATSLEALGTPKVPPLGDAAELDAVARDLGISPVFSELRSAEDALAFLLGLEEALIGLWVQAHRRLGDARLLQTAASILGCQAQHAVVLRQALGRDPLPRALETGRGG